ncbi:MAG: gephyrin-like molybdotransferase Glp [Balneolaceae bacterium]|nr:gephyrin-like molybdotransferase Glp [Balneolaceae bacterium]
MVSIEEALHTVYSQKITLAETRVPLSKSLGFCLAEKIVSPFDLPSFDNSAMDGFAVCGISDSYHIVGEVAAGSTAQVSLKQGEAMRIFTGSKVPDNTTAVIMQEKTRVDGSTVYCDDTAQEGKNIRLKGKELKKGQNVFEAGHVVTPATLGMIGSLGINTLDVFQKPAVRIITTGNELLALGETRKEGQIYESNSLALTGALEQFGYYCIEKQQISDDFEQIKAGIEEYLSNSDLLILSGGTSVGEYDYVKQALLENGVEQLFYKVFQKPGKPLFFGRKKDKYVFALPGNPASSLTCFYVYVLPILQKMSGVKATGLPRVSIPIANSYESNSDRPVFLKAKVENQKVTILNNQGSSMIHSMATGNALVFLKEPQLLQEGDLAECILI